MANGYVEAPERIKLNRSGNNRSYNNIMQITVDGVQIPDPSKWTYQVGDLDTSGNRDATGLLHRAYVATKINYEFQWNGLGWEALQLILGAVNEKSKFTLVAPDPRTFNTFYTGDYYVGDRTGECNFFLAENEDLAAFSLKMKFIEY